jgi:uncharacterized protein YjbI with pentapeptide repeats/very-short-patch-repair endonuclease
MENLSLKLVESILEGADADAIAASVAIAQKLGKLTLVDWVQNAKAPTNTETYYNTQTHMDTSELLERYAAGKRDFFYLNLSGADLYDADLSGANLSGADLSEADLSRAKLNNAILSEAKLGGANLREANLSKANLSKTDLGCANLREANLSKANLSKTDLGCANLREVNLCGADLRGADLNKAELSKAELSKVNLREAKLREARLNEANLSRADLRGADLNKADLSGADLSGADLSGANLSRGDLCRADLSGADLNRANLSGADLCRADLSGADLGGADLSVVDLGEPEESSANLSEANLSEANLSEANLSGADLSGANLSRADLNGADLSGANLSRANLSEANLSGANLSEANLIGANLFETDLTNTKLSKAKLDGTILIYQKKAEEIQRENQELKGSLLLLKTQFENLVEKQVEKRLIANQGIKAKKSLTWEGMRFRSKPEREIAKVLDEMAIMFFPLPSGRVMTEEGMKTREVDFLVCSRGKWGILECDGGLWHTFNSITKGQIPSAALDHKRDNDFNRHGQWFIKRFTDEECKENPHKVVRQFLDMLHKFHEDLRFQITGDSGETKTSLSAINHDVKPKESSLKTDFKLSKLTLEDFRDDEEDVLF